MVFEGEVVDGILRVNCLGSIYGASLEDSDVLMARVVDYLMAEPKVVGIVLAESREYEYDLSQTKMLVEIARAITSIVRDKRLVSIKNFPLGWDQTPLRFSWLQNLVTVQLREDPVGAYVNLIREIRHVKTRAEKDFQKDFYSAYLNILEQIQEVFDECSLIQRALPYLTGYHVGDRSLYREFFHPSVRPNFMFTKYMAQPPVGEALERYHIGDMEIEIFKIPGKTRYVYHVVPPEFRLSEDEYVLLDGARRILEERRPKEFEMKEQEKMREIFFNIGIELLRDLAEETGKAITKEQIDKLASILTRYTAGLGIIEILLADEKIQDIYINSPLGTVPVYVFHNDYEECETNLIPTRIDGERWATRFKLISGRPLDEANPVLDTETAAPGGRARIACIYPRLAPDGMGLALRRHRDRPWTFPLFLNAKYFDPLFAGLMSFISDYGRSYLIAGGRSSGKTSLLGSCMLEILPRYRVVTIEDTLELPVEQLQKLGYNIERLKSRSVITRVETELPAEEALRTALRLGDSCLIIGEVRSSLRGDEEVVIIDNGIMKRVQIRDLENKDLSKVYVPTMGFDLKVKLSKLTDFVKHPKRKKLLRIKTRTGREVTVTHDHSLFAPTKNFEIAPIECKDLKIGDQIVIPCYMPCGFNDIEFINVFDYLPEFRVKNFEIDVRKAIKKLGWKKATEICKINCGDVYNYFRQNQKTNIPFNSFSNLMGTADIDYDPIALEVKKGTSLSLPAIIPVDEEFCRFLGYYVSEGYYSLKGGSGGSVVITNSNTEIIEDISKISQNLFKLSPRTVITKGLGKSIQNQFHCLPLAKLISKLNCGRICTEKRVPPIIFGLSKKKIAAFLSALYSGDGSFTSSEISGNCIRYFSTSKRLIEDVSYLLLNFNIVGTIRKRKPHERGKQNLWILEFKDRKMVEIFLNEIGFIGKKPKMVIKKWSHTKSNSVKFDKKLLKKHLIKYPRRYRHLFRFLRCSKNYLEGVVLDPECKVTEKLKTFALGDFFLDEIKEIEEIELNKSEYVYDISVEPTENFIGGFGGILLHNTESKALYEAMRIGALANVVAGTIHGESAYGVFDRVVNDLGVPPTSFKATDLIVICSRLRSADGLHTFRRVVEVTEVRKHWKSDPQEEGGFVNLMEYSAKQDALKPTATLLNGESFILNEIAQRVREWSGNWSAVWENILLRGKICQGIAEIANATANPELMEAEARVSANEMFHLLSERSRTEVGSIDAERVYNEWLEWFKQYAKSS